VTDGPSARSLLGRLALALWPFLHRAAALLGGRRPKPAVSAAVPRKPRVLVVSPLSIHPVIHGGAVRISNLIRRMAPASRVSLLVLGGGTDDPGHRCAYEPFCERVLFQHLPDPGDPVHDPWGLLPPASRRFCHATISDRISALVDAHRFDIVQLEYAELGAHVRRLDGARTVLVEHDIGFRTQQRQRALDIGRRFDAAASVGSGDADGRRQERFEILACAAADQVHCMSEDDRDLLASKLTAAGHLRVIPNGVDTGVYQPGPAADRRGALFLGSFPHLPNLDAFELLVDEVWPAVRRRLPDAALTVAGARPPDRVLAWDGRDGIRVVGEVDEAAPLYRSHRVLVVPLRAGSGTRLKILEALASGLPVVSTTIGAEGLALSDPPEITIADDPQAMADRVAELLRADDEHIEAVGRRGRTLTVARYDWDAIADDLTGAYAELIALGPTAAPVRVIAADPPAATASPEISVIIPSSNRVGLTPALLDALTGQTSAAVAEIVCVDFDSPQKRLDRWRAMGMRVLSVRGDAANLGATLNAGAAAARGRVLVFTSATAIPADEHWLARLTAPFDRPDAPAAVQGGITSQLVDGAPAHDPGFTWTSRRWRADHGGLEFSLVNAAMPRSVWERFPFPPRVLADRAWQRIVGGQDFLILPCLAAAVRDVRPGTALGLIRSSMVEGRAWRDLGVRYRTAGCWADHVHGLPAVGEDGQATAATTNGHRAYRILRPIGLYLGNRFSRP
jgi:glycosyltransferase involved in cell wall biosynthesis